jgi:hypothetical protein
LFNRTAPVYNISNRFRAGDGVLRRQCWPETNDLCVCCLASGPPIARNRRVIAAATGTNAFDFAARPQQFPESYARTSCKLSEIAGCETALL